jgi:16S rRNA (cytosine967-C5)-methyltransferase
MKIHRPLADAVIKSLHLIFNENKYADKVIEKTLKQSPPTELGQPRDKQPSKWGARDRRFIAETIYDIVRWKDFYQEVSRSGESDYWKWFAVWILQHEFQYPDWTEFSTINVKQIRAGLSKDYSRRIKESIPLWMDELGIAELGSRWEKELHALNEQAQVVLRVNTLKISVKELAAKLLSDEIETDGLSEFPNALVLRKRQNIFQTIHFKEGLFEVMDAASQTIAPFLNVEPGHRVVDACAGAGGKTLHLSALMNNKGKVIALDTEAWKLDELSKRARRAGAFNIETRLADSGKVIKRLENSADRLLLDVPCSGLGVLKRNPDAKWKMSLDFIARVKELQENILNDYCMMVKVGGFMVYSTCSILPSENERQVEKFLVSHQNQFELMEEKRCWPSEGFDGFYMARMRRVN